MAVKIEGYIAEDVLARSFGLSVWGLRAWRKRGYGPPVRKFGRAVFYKVEDVEAFIAEPDAKLIPV